MLRKGQLKLHTDKTLLDEFESGGDTTMKERVKERATARAQVGIRTLTLLREG